MLSDKEQVWAVFWGPALTLSFCALQDPKVMRMFLKEYLAHRNILLTN